MKIHNNIFTTLFFCLTFVPLTSNAIPVGVGDIIRVDFDLSAETPAPPYEGIYTVLGFGSGDYLNMGEGFSLGVFDDDGVGLTDGTGYFLLYDIVGTFDLSFAQVRGRFYDGGMVSDTTAYIDGTISSLATLPDLGSSLATLFTYENTVSDNISWFGHDRILLPQTAAAVPEPASLTLMGLGLAGLGFSRRKKAT